MDSVDRGARRLASVGCSISSEISSDEYDNRDELWLDPWLMRYAAFRAWPMKKGTQIQQREALLSTIGFQVAVSRTGQRGVCFFAARSQSSSRQHPRIGATPAALFS